jgi:ABC-type polysaccharide/polyol phosphate export permease
LFFVVGQLPRETWVYFTWNPLLHINEFTRSCWFPIYHSPIASAGYIAECLLGVLLFGLIFERSTRRIGR